MKSDIETVARGDSSRVVRPRDAIARSDVEWLALWTTHVGPGIDAPAIDFDSRMVAAVFAGERPTPGYEIAIVGNRLEGDVLAILVEQRTPQSGTVAAQILVSPFHIVTVPRHDGEVRFAHEQSIRIASARAIAHPAGGRRRHTPTPSSTGLEPRIAGALAYLAGPFSGALLLKVERTSHFVRFHAWQALIGLGTLGVAAVACLALAFFVLVVSPTAFWVMLWLAAVLAACWVVLWSVCLVQAYRGHRWKLPVAGSYAERLAYR